MDNIQNRPSCSAMEQDVALLLPKRPRLDCIITNSTDLISFEFPKPMTFQTKCVEADHEYVRHTGHQDENAEATSKRNKVSQISAGTHSICYNSTEDDLQQGKDGQNPLTGERKMFHVVEDVAESHTSDDSLCDATPIHDFCHPGKSLQCTLAGHPSANDFAPSEQSKDSPIPLATCSSAEGGSDILPGSACEKVFEDANAFSETKVSLEGTENNLNENVVGFCQNVCNVSKERNCILPSDCKDYESSNSELSSCGRCSEAGANDESVVRQETEVKENASICNEETEACVYSHVSKENDPLKVETVACENFSVVTDDVKLDCDSDINGAEINEGLLNDHLHNVTWGISGCERTIGTQIKLDDRHTTEKLFSSQEPSEGGDQRDLGPASVIGPTVSSNADREAGEEEHCHFVWISGVESSFSERRDLAVSSPSPEHSSPRLSEPIQCENITSALPGHLEELNGGQGGSESQDICRSAMELHCSTAVEPDTNSQGITHQELAPSNSVPGPTEGFHATQEVEAYLDTVGHLCEEPNPAGEVFTCPDLLVKGFGSPSPSERAVLRETMDADERKVIKTEFHFKADDFEVDRIAQEGSALHGHQEMTETLTSIWIKDWAERQSTPALDPPVEATPGEKAAREHLSAGYNDKIGPLVIENEDISFFTPVFPCDAVVPVPYSHPEKDEHDTLAHQGDRHSGPSAFLVPSNWVPVAFDTFEKIQFSLDNGEVEGLEHSPLLHRSPKQALNPGPHLQQASPEAERNTYKGKPQEEEKEECLKDITYFCSEIISDAVPDFTSRKVPSLMSTEHPESTDCMVYGSSQSNLKPDLKLSSINKGDCVNDYIFEMKDKFDLVVEELSLYFEISQDSGEATATGPCIREVLSQSQEYASASCFSDHQRSPTAGTPRDMSTGDDEATLESCGAEPEKACTADCLDSEQEVPVDCSLLSEGEDLMYSSVRQKEPREAEQRGQTWDPAFCFPSGLDHFNSRKPEHNQRLEPLKTCARPIRVGLSKKAKTKQLHPYK